MDVHSFRWSDSSHWLDHADYLGDDGRQPDPQELFPRDPRVGSRARRSRHSLANHGPIATDRKEDPELDAQSLTLALPFRTQASLNEIPRSLSNGAGMKMLFICAVAIALLGVTVLSVSSDTTN